MKNIYMVKQYWYDEEIDDEKTDGEVIHIFTKEEDAIKLTRRFNLRYAEGVVLDETGELLKVKKNIINYHYYIYVKRIVEDEIDEERIAKELKDYDLMIAQIKEIKNESSC